ncbi:MAG: glycosyltransferase [Ignavibacteriaceae bacterium]
MHLDENLPTVSILISAFNEEKVIRERIENIYKLSYNFEKLEVLIGSDCSTDQTNNILTELSHKYSWLKIKLFTSRGGKVSVLNELASLAENDILVFTDANTDFDKNALDNMVNKFGDEKVGGVSGRLVLVEPSNNFNKINKEKLYWTYETFVKKYEGEIGVLISANGAIYSIRKNLFKKFPEKEAVTDDLYQTLSVLTQRYKFLYSFNSTATEEISNDLKTEFKRKIRFSATNFQTLKLFKGLLFHDNLLLSYTLWSHKIIRWFVPIMLIVLLIINSLISGYGNIYNIIFIVQLAFYFLSIIGFIFSSLKINVPVISMIYYFVITNLALFIGLLKYSFGKHSAVWESTPR